MTTPSNSDGQLLLAAGVTVQVLTAAGEPADVDLRFKSRALARLETEFGSLDDFADTLRRQPINTVAVVFQVTMGVSKDQALDMIDTRQLSAYLDAIGAALAEALGNEDPNPGNPEAPGS